MIQTTSIMNALKVLMPRSLIIPGLTTHSEEAACSYIVYQSWNSKFVHQSLRFDFTPACTYGSATLLVGSQAWYDFLRLRNSQEILAYMICSSGI